MSKKRGVLTQCLTPNFVDLLVTFALITVAIPIVIFFEVRPLISTIYFFILPSLYLLWRKPKNLVRTFAGSFLIGIVFGFSFDFVAIVNNAWADGNGQLIFGHIFDVVPIDHIIWFFFWAFIIIVFYEHFLEHENTNRISKNYIYAALPTIFIAIAVPIVHFINPNVFLMGYAYLVLGIFATLPLVLLVWKKPHLAIKFLKIAPFFFILFLAFELTALYLNQWMFLGEYIGYVEILGLRFPIEEFFFWICVSSMVVLSDYEILVDDLQ
ncbi:MAG: hypothetical protein AAB605_02985 [Patescibacteria group bacterium]